MKFIPQKSQYSFCISLNLNKVSFSKSLEPSHGVIQSLKKNFYSVFILHLLKPLFSVFQLLSTDHPYLLSLISTDINSFFLEQICLYIIILFFFFFKIKRPFR